MVSSRIVSTALWGACLASANPGSSIADKLLQFRDQAMPRMTSKPARHQLRQRAELDSIFLTDKSEKFAVNGTHFPQVPFDIGESYAGLLPITANESDPNQLFFWFFPSSNPEAANQITIWQQGGPGCSGMNGLLNENGPFLWQPGVYEPFPNPYSWTNLTNMVWIDQPYGTGLSQGVTNVTDDIQAAEQFMGFWKNFVDTFSMHDYDVYLVGESYGGQSVPYLAATMLEANDTTYFNVKGMELIDPVIGDFALWAEVPMYNFVQDHMDIYNLNSSYMGYLADKAADYIEYYEAHINEFPPSGPFPPVPIPGGDADWDITSDVLQAAVNVNPCFNPYHIVDTCPFVWNKIQLYGLGGGPSNFFNDSAVQAALHVPPTDFSPCSNAAGLLYDDNLPVSSQGPLPAVIEATGNVIISHGNWDMVGLANGSLLCIQNMTWSGLQGFQNPPPADLNLVMPYHYGLDEIWGASLQVPFTQTAGAGLMGKWQTERGLTFSTVFNAGHEMPQYTPGVAYRFLELLLGRIPSLDFTGPYTS
ncbi:serine-type carboxypeptidase F [Xylariales sp. PMI_506]|nr:serine-type carboxypeptidase F [Xylariales sp. PMI_506]